MRTIEIGRHTVELYDTIDQLPITRYHVFNKNVMLDAGIGSDLEDIDKRAASSIQMIRKGDHDDAVKEINNMRAAFINVVENVNPKLMSFAALVHSIDGKRYDDMSTDGLKRVLGIIGATGVSYGTIAGIWDFVKKKLRRKSRRTSRNNQAERRLLFFTNTLKTKHQRP